MTLRQPSPAATITRSNADESAWQCSTRRRIQIAGVRELIYAHSCSRYADELTTTLLRQKSAPSGQRAPEQWIRPLLAPVSASSFPNASQAAGSYHSIPRRRASAGGIELTASRIAAACLLPRATCRQPVLTDTLVP